MSSLLKRSLKRVAETSPKSKLREEDVDAADKPESPSTVTTSELASPANLESGSRDCMEPSPARSSSMFWRRGGTSRNASADRDTTPAKSPNLASTSPALPKRILSLRGAGGRELAPRSVTVVRTPLAGTTPIGGNVASPSQDGDLFFPETPTQPTPTMSARSWRTKASQLAPPSSAQSSALSPSALAGSRMDVSADKTVTFSSRAADWPGRASSAASARSQSAPASAGRGNSNSDTDTDSDGSDAGGRSGRLGSSRATATSEQLRGKTAAWAEGVASATVSRGLGVELPPPSSMAGLGNRVDYLIMVARNAELYSRAQSKKLILIRGGRQMIDALHEVWGDLRRQRDKVLAVYDAREVRRCTDRLGDTLRRTYEVVGDLEKTTRLFGRKKTFGKRVTALVHDIGTNGNALLAAASLAIQDRPHMLYMVEGQEGGPPAAQMEELQKRCRDADRRFFGCCGDVSFEKAFEGYLWAAERGLPDAMYMVAWMYKHGYFIAQDEAECIRWLELACDKQYPPALNELGLFLLRQADDVEVQYPELGIVTGGGSAAVESGYAPKPNDIGIGAVGSGSGDRGGGNDGGRAAGLDSAHGGGREDQEEKDDSDDEEHDEFDDGGDGDDGGGRTSGISGGEGSGSGGGGSSGGGGNGNGGGGNSGRAGDGYTDLSGGGDDSALCWPRPAGLAADLGRAWDDVAEKRRRAMRLFAAAARKGHTDAMTNLGNVQEALGCYESAESWYLLAARPTDAANNARAQNYLGLLYYEGRGVRRNCIEAVKWFKRSADQGHAQGCNNLGLCYEAGLVVGRDVARALTLYRRGADGGSIMAAANVAYMLARDALHTLGSMSNQCEFGGGCCGKCGNWASAAGGAPAGTGGRAGAAGGVTGDGCSIAAILDGFASRVQDGLRYGSSCSGGVEKCHQARPRSQTCFENPAAGLMHTAARSSAAATAAVHQASSQLRVAADLFRRAADAGVTDASYQLGRLYQQGLGLPADPVAAYQNFLEAAQSPQGHAAAATCAGHMRYSGVGCQQSFYEATRLYRLAARGDNETADFGGCGVVCGGRLSGGGRSSHGGSGSGGGDPEAMNCLGLMHESGLGMVRDWAGARAWYTLGAAEGSAHAAFNLGCMLERGEPDAVLASIVKVQSYHQQQYSPPAFAGAAAANAGAGAAATAAVATLLQRVRLSAGDAGAAAASSSLAYDGGGGGGRVTAELPSLSDLRAAHTAFQRAAALGHPDAPREAERLQIRVRMEQIAAAALRREHVDSAKSLSVPSPPSRHHLQSQAATAATAGGEWRPAGAETPSVIIAAHTPSRAEQRSPRRASHQAALSTHQVPGEGDGRCFGGGGGGTQEGCGSIARASGVEKAAIPLSACVS